MSSATGGQVDVGPVPTPIVGAPASMARIYNMGSSRIFYGGRDVDTTSPPLMPGEAVEVVVGRHGIFGVAFAPPTVTVAWSEI